MQSAVREGESMAKPLMKYKVFPPMVVQMIAVGEETGQVDTMLEKVASFYNQEVEASVDALTSLIEPLLIADHRRMRGRRRRRALHADVPDHQADPVGRTGNAVRLVFAAAGLQEPPGPTETKDEAHHRGAPVQRKGGEGRCSRVF